MGQPLKRSAGQSVEEMAEQLEGTGHSRLYATGKASYPEASSRVKADSVRAAIDQTAEMLELLRSRGKVDLDSLEEVQFTVEMYTESCKKAGIIPTMLGFSAACGISRPTLYRYIATRRNATVEYLEAVRTAWSSILASQALARNASEAVGIFLLKNSSQGLRDDAASEIIQPPDENEIFQKADEIVRKYQDLP